MARRYYSTTAVQTTLDGAITSGDTSLTLADASGYPSTAPFTIVIDSGTASEEVILVGARTGTACSSLTRGFAGTSAAAHSSGAAISHVGVSTDLEDAAQHRWDTPATAGDSDVGASSNHHTLETTASTQAFGDSAAAGASFKAAPGLHKHAMPANPVTAHEAAGDPHGGYVLNAELSTHESDTSTHGVGEVVGRTETQTLTNKTLTAPTIADFTNANHDHGDADDGGALSLTDFTNMQHDHADTDDGGPIGAAAIPNDSITPDKLALGDDGVITADSGTTASATFADLDMAAGPAVTVTVGASGKCLVGISAQLANDTASAFSIVGVDVSGASTVAASIERAISLQQTSSTGQDVQCSRLLYFEGLTAGSTTFTMKYAVTAGTGTFLRREIFAIPL